MPVGSHKDAFKAHQLAKKLADKSSGAVLARLAQEILMDFVKNARQVNTENIVAELPEDLTPYDIERCDRALEAVEGLCGKCDESHDNYCFVNQARRILIKIRTRADIGLHFDGKKSLEDLLKEAEEMARIQEQTAALPAAGRVLNESRERFEEPVGVGLGAQVAALEHRYREIVEKDLFRSTLIDEIAATIAKVAEGNFAADMPVHDDEQLGKLASTFNLMLDTINRTMSHLDGLVAERSANLRRIMNTVPVGLLSLDEQLRVNPEYSLACETILKVENLRGRHFADLIGLTKNRSDERAKLEEFLDLFLQQILPEEDMAPLNPVAELQLPENDGGKDGGEKSRESDRRRRDRVRLGTWIRTNFHLIDRGPAKPPHLLVTIQDITRAKEMAAEIVKADRENMQLKAIAEDPDLFCDFLSEAKRIVSSVAARLEGLNQAQDPRPSVNEMFRGVHTIKGTGASLGLDGVSRMAAGLEEEFSRLREASAIDPQTMATAKTALEELQQGIEEVATRTGKLLGQSIGEEDDAVLRISARTLEARMEKIKLLDIPENARREILDGLMELRLVKARKGLGRALRIVPGLIEKLDRQILFELEGEETPLDVDIARKLNTPLVHLLRNALDHGIEPAEEREAKGKPVEGTLRLVIRQDGSAIELLIEDDGRGLDPLRLREKAVTKGLLTQSEAQELDDAASRELIFLPGFSTAEAVSDVSGRGVGMDAVLATVRDDLGGTVTIRSEPGSGTSFIIRFPALRC